MTAGGAMDGPAGSAQCAGCGIDVLDPDIADPAGPSAAGADFSGQRHHSRDRRVARAHQGVGAGFTQPGAFQPTTTR